MFNLTMLSVSCTSAFCLSLRTELDPLSVLAVDFLRLPDALPFTNVALTFLWGKMNKRSFSYPLDRYRLGDFQDEATT